ncbi:MAG: hypothetical protein ABI720_05270 [Actinomycetes bacterium]
MSSGSSSSGSAGSGFDVGGCEDGGWVLGELVLDELVGDGVLDGVLDVDVDGVGVGVGVGVDELVGDCSGVTEVVGVGEGDPSSALAAGTVINRFTAVAMAIAAVVARPSRRAPCAGRFAGSGDFVVMSSLCSGL